MRGSGVMVEGDCDPYRYSDPLGHDTEGVQPLQETVVGNEHVSITVGQGAMTEEPTTSVNPAVWKTEKQSCGTNNDRFTPCCVRCGRVRDFTGMLTQT